jgi:ATP-dependent RNA helicase RhlE
LKSFEELNLLPNIKQALREEKYDQPTPIQAQTIPSALDGRDILGNAQTGTGKTAAFALPILHRLAEKPRKAHPNRPLALVLAPTRELAIQIEESFTTYGRHLRLRHVLVYGGVTQGNQVRALQRGAHVLIATPGRLLDLMDQGHIDLGQLEVFVLDEADRMLDMGFMPALKRIVSRLPSARQSLFFSATMPPKILELAQQLLSDPVHVNVTPKQKSVERIEQRLFFVERASKLSLLQKILSSPEVDRAIVFAKTKRGANMLAERLAREGLRSAVIHGNKSQNARQRALDAFKNRQVQVLVATDIAARGIDIDNISHVINYDLPVDAESYVHRIGRTGRAGAGGQAWSFCTPAEMSELHEIETLLGQPIPLAPGQVRPRGTSGARPTQDRASNRGTKRPASGQRATSGQRAASGQRRTRTNPSVSSSPPRPDRQPLAATTTATPPKSTVAGTAHVPHAAGGTAAPTSQAKRPLQRKIRRIPTRTTFSK